MAQDWFSQATAPAPSPQAAPQRQGRIIPDRYRASDEARKQEDQILERQRLDLARGDAARSDAKFQFDVANVDRGSVPPGWRRTADGGLEPEPGGPADPNSPANDRNRLTAEARAKVRADLDALGNLRTGLEELRSLYQSGRGSTKGASSIRDILPTTENREFIDSGNRLSAFVATALGLTGQKFNTPAEQRLFIGPYLPGWTDTDAQVERKIQSLERIYNNAARAGAAAIGVDQPPLFNVPDQDAVGARRQSLSVTNVADFAAGLSGGEYRFTPDGGLTYNGQQVEFGMDVGNSPEFREAYREQMGEYPPLYADVVGGVVPPAEQTRLEQDRDTTFGEIDAAVRGGADMLTLGIADPLAAAVRGAFNDDSFGDNLARERTISETDERVNPIARVSGQIAGGIAPFYGAARLGAAAMPSRPVTGAALGETAAGSFYGGVSTPDDPVAGALLGGGAALVGNQVGQRVIGPVAKSLLSRGTEPASQSVRTLARSADDLDADPVLSALRDAKRLDVPMSLADADPKLRTLAGSSVRLAPAAREFAETTLLPRGRAQAERAMGAIERDFGPTVDVARAGDDLMSQARSASSALYDEAYRAPVVSTPELESLLSTPAGRQALARARTIAANERRDPSALGFVLDESGEVMLQPVSGEAFAAQAAARAELTDAQASYRAARTGSGDMAAATARMEAARAALRQADDGLRNARFSSGTAQVQPGYTTQTLDYVKRGMDDILEERRDPVTRRLVLDEAGRAINGVRASLVREIDRVNPAYAQARAAYEGPAKQRDALNAGVKATGTRTSGDTLSRMVEGYDPARMGQFQTGYRSSMADQVEAMRFSANPFDRLHGTPDQVAKIGQLFPEGADNFARQAELETMLARTQNETLGGSPSAGRIAADAQFAPGLGVQLAGETALGIMSGVPPIASMTNVARATLRDRMRLGIGGSKRAESIAQLLLEPNPEQALTTVERILLEQELRNQARGAGGLIGASASPALIPAE